MCVDTRASGVGHFYSHWKESWCVPFTSGTASKILILFNSKRAEKLHLVDCHHKVITCFFVDDRITLIARVRAHEISYPCRSRHIGSYDSIRTVMKDSKIKDLGFCHV